MPWNTSILGQIGLVVLYPVQEAENSFFRMQGHEVQYCVEGWTGHVHGVWWIVFVWDKWEARTGGLEIGEEGVRMICSC
jgi:hypothetical protein